MKIICVEEHVVDPGLSEAGRAVLQKNAPYFTEVGNYFGGNIEDGDDKRPMSIGFPITMKLAADYGDGRITEMDRHHIDMQVLSCSNPHRTLRSMRKCR
jgi:hypothetical protein